MGRDNDLHILENEVMDLSEMNPKFKDSIVHVKPTDIRNFKQIIGLSHQTSRKIPRAHNFLSPAHLEVVKENEKIRQLKMIAKEYVFGDSESVSEYEDFINVHLIPSIDILQAAFRDIIIEPKSKLIAKVDVLLANNITIKRNGMLIKGRDSLTINCNRIKGGYHDPLGVMIDPGLAIDFPLFVREKSFVNMANLRSSKSNVGGN
jgi:hypothetical protein